MPNLKTKDALVNEVGERIPDNNAGSISAADIREPLQDLTFSINSIVASGNHNDAFPFIGNVRTKGTFIAEQGISFASGPTQTIPYPGPEGISHNSLADRDNIASHPVFLDLGGTRTMTGSIRMGGKYISASGDSVSGRGLKFDYTPSGDKITVGTNTTINFQDGSQFSSARGVAKAWINFDASAVLTVNSYHNISIIEKEAVGQFKITIPSGILKNENCVCFGHSNSRSAAPNPSSFDRNHIGIVDRNFTPSGEVTISFQVLNEASQYTDAEINDLVVFGYDVDEPTQAGIVIIDE